MMQATPVTISITLTNEEANEFLDSVNAANYGDTSTWIGAIEAGIRQQIEAQLLPGRKERQRSWLPKLP